jgi:Ankyrin repeats (3 copies)
MLATSVGEESSVRELLRRGANCTTRNDQGNSALALCTVKGNLSMVKLHQQCGAVISVRESNPEGRAAFVMAAREGWVHLMTYLLSQTTPPDSSMGAALSDALCTAAAEGHQRAVHFLVRYGADVNSSGSSGATPLSAAEQRGHRDVVKQLLAAGAKRDTATTASASSGAQIAAAAPAAKAAMAEAPTLAVTLPVAPTVAPTVAAEEITTSTATRTAEEPAVAALASAVAAVSDAAAATAVPVTAAGAKPSTVNGNSAQAPVSTVIAATSTAAEPAVAAAAAATTSAAPVAAAVSVNEAAVAGSVSSARSLGTAGATTSAAAEPAVTATATAVAATAATAAAASKVAAAAATALAAAAAVAAVPTARERRARAHALLDELLKFEQLPCDYDDVDEPFEEADSDSEDILLGALNKQLLAAVMNDDVDAAAEALDCGADVDATDEDGKY